MFRIVGLRARLGVRHYSYGLPKVALLDNVKLSGGQFTGLYSNKAVQQLWFGRGQQITDELNQLLEENNITNPPSDLNELIALTFNKPELHKIYSHASKLHNLQFTLESLKPSVEQQDISKCSEQELFETPSIATSFPNEPTDPALRDWIITSFGSIAEFRSVFLSSAKAIKGDGITWLVARAQATPTQDTFVCKDLFVMNTYNAGIVDDAIRSGQIQKFKLQKQARAQNEQIETDNEAEQSEPEARSIRGIPNNLVLGSPEEAEFAALYSTRKLLPILAIDASMRNYLFDYGVFGKQKYLDNLWNCIDWEVVSRRLPARLRSAVEF